MYDGAYCSCLVCLISNAATDQRDHLTIKAGTLLIWLADQPKGHIQPFKNSVALMEAVQTQ